VGALSPYRGFADIGGKFEAWRHRAGAEAIFRPHLERSPWMRFNVAVCEDTRCCAGCRSNYQAALPLSNLACERPGPTEKSMRQPTGDAHTGLAPSVPAFGRRDATQRDSAAEASCVLRVQHPRVRVDERTIAVPPKASFSDIIHRVARCQEETFQPRSGNKVYSSCAVHRKIGL
jgi:hypothetical protein